MAELKEADAAQLHQEDVDNKRGDGGDGPFVAEETLKSESATDDDAKPSITTAERHLSIQTKLEGLEMLVDLSGAGRKSCPLCPEEKFKACYSHKLRRHLQNLHWKVYAEFEGYRMCICHLPCRNVKPSLSGDHASGRHVAHYHCVVCSVTIARKTDMISHLKRHVNKGETEASYSGTSDVLFEEPSPSGQAYEIMKELGTNVQLLPNHTTPQKSDTYFNRKMKPNRQLVFCSLAVLAEERNPVECLDAFGATGIMGLQWAKHLLNAVRVTITDISETCVKMIKENCKLNNIRVDGGMRVPRGSDGPSDEVEGVPIATVEVVKMDANVIMHLRPFDYIHLDPFGTAVNYLDAAFRNVRNLGIISVTSTDTSSLYAKSPNVTLRHYGCHIVRTEYYKELAARMVVATVARAAARCNKGIEVLLAVALEHFVLVVVRVLRGPVQADESAKKLRKLMHCQWCEERVFLKQGNMVDDTLPCNCHGSLPGKTAVQLGPLWSGPLFNTGFLRRMLSAAVKHSMDDIQPLVKTLIYESECNTLKSLVHGPSALTNQVECGVVIKTLNTGEESGAADQSGKRKIADESGNFVKKLKSDAALDHPPFYYSIHRHSIRGMNMPKLNKFLQYLTEAGFRVSRTHFDPTGVRTDATLLQFKSVLAKYSVPTCTNASATQTSVSMEKTV
ncbi:tRNA (guanine(27)-N(2))-dimethyltransferase [Maylandia zebra]|uniref:tRNA (guanine(27)-N(2))-dimethyltransferase n=2 Tax=Haplochromini TaxID=319058 RepID=A0A9Y3RDX6_9CICH|nr:TRMT1-like protein [Maylandia zebra]XP_005734333.1 PREDICTED: TRMT1-like protein [Pundamilia nyererei]